MQEPERAGDGHGWAGQRSESRGRSIVSGGQTATYIMGGPYLQPRPAEASEAVLLHLDGAMSVDSPPRCLRGVRQLVRSDSHHTTVFAMQVDALPHQLAGHTVVDPDEMGCCPQPRAREVSQRVEVDIVHGVGQKDDDGLPESCQILPSRERGGRRTDTAERTSSDQKKSSMASDRPERC
jgi:hypothetical protein